MPEHRMRPQKSLTTPALRRTFATLLIAATALAPACSHPAAPPAPPTITAAPEIPPTWTLHVQRRQTTYLPLNLPVIVTGTQIDITLPQAPATWYGGPRSLSLYSTRILRGAVTGPAVDQLTGYPETPSDRGSYLLPLPAAAQTTTRFLVHDPMPLYLQLDISPLQDPGKYRFPITLTLPGKPPEKSLLEVDVSSVSLPTQPRVLAVATTTADALTRIFPAPFSPLNPRYLDRADPDQRPAVDQLDTLVKTAERAGIALFVEDLGPRVNIDQVGRVLLNWDAYDRVLQPYMDGSAFDDRIPLPIWLAPLAPARIADSPTQLRQYIAACAQHFADKGWVATPAFLHEALASSATADPQRRADISKTLRLHMVRDMLAVTTPDAVVPQPRLWVVDDSDPRLPPAGELATEQSVRLWPWICAARSGKDARRPQATWAPLPPATTTETSADDQNVRGFVWRNALASSTHDATHNPLFIATPDASIAPSLRLLWLQEGLNDTAMLGLLEHRGDPALVQELLAGIVGRTALTGTSATPEPSAAIHFPLPDPGYLYAGWPDDNATWAAVPSMLEKLVLASEPGASEKMSANDPLYMATKLWLAKSRRPVARIAGYDLRLRAGREGDILNWTVGLLVENPINAPVEIAAAFPLLPGDLELAPQPTDAGRGGRHSVNVAPYGIHWLALPIAGHLDTLTATAGTALTPLEVTERNRGATLQVPISLPILRCNAMEGGGGAGEGGLKIDGSANDWPAPASADATMSIATHYLSRPALLKGAVRLDDSPALARCTFDKDYLYVLIHCPQSTVTDERNNDWPLQNHRWWGTDGLQLQLADPIKPTRIIEVAFKPGGVMMTCTAALSDHPLTWVDGAPTSVAGASGPTNARYGTSVDKTDGRTTGYLVEAAIPRAWFSSPPEGTSPAWRINILRHRASDLTSTSWSGPLVNDDDVAMMGLLIGKP